MENYLKETKLLNFNHPSITNLISEKNWNYLSDVNKVKRIYNYVRDEIEFGYNASDSIKASTVLSDGYGQCNTKATLLMTLLRAVGIPNRIHGFTIDKELQKGAIDGIWYKLSPQNILHSWVEVNINNNWYILEGVILDRLYLKQLQRLNQTQTKTFCGFGVFTDNFANPPIEWDLNNTFIQDKGINQDFGVFDSPDDFYAKYQQQVSWFKKAIFKYFARYLINRNVQKIRMRKKK